MAKGSAFLYVCLGLALALSGCGGGGGGGPLNISRQGSITRSDLILADGSRGDVVRFTATRNGYIQIDMTTNVSDPIADPYIIVWRGSADPGDVASGDLIGFDDNSGAGLDASFSFYAYSGERYTVLFATYDAGDFGNYRYSIFEDVGAAGVASQEGPQSAPGKQPIPPTAKVGR